MDLRASILSNVIAFTKSLDELAKELCRLDWDCPNEVVSMSSQDLINILDRFLQDDINKKELEDWANLIECREDIDFQKGVESIIYNLANPELEGVITPLKVKDYIKTLKNEAPHKPKGGNNV